MENNKAAGLMDCAKILCAGYDHVLLESRRNLLRQSFDVEVAIGGAELAGSDRFDLLILCHTLSAEDCRRVNCALHAQEPRPKVLALRKATGELNATFADREFFIEDGPKQLLKAAEEMLEEWRERAGIGAAAGAGNARGTAAGARGRSGPHGKRMPT